nr:hypothetical protein [Tanacetum cinerariifolium]
MTSLADKAILSGADNRPPMLGKDMYDSWKSQIELYMLNRQHARMILESVENGPLLWPTVEENGVTRLKKYSELSTTEAIQADYDNSNADARNVFDKASEGVQAYASQAPSSTPLLITYPPNDFHSSVNHNIYNASSSIPQMEYAPTVHQQTEFSPPDTRLVVLVFQKGDDPFDAINHMMSFLTAVVTSRYPTMNNQLRTSSNPRQKATINNGRGKGHMSKQCTKPKRNRDEEWFKDKIALMVNLSHYGSDNLAEDNKNVNEILTAELERYKNQVKILKEQNNVDKASESCAQSLEIDNLKHILSEHLKEKESLEQKVKELNNIVFKRNQSAQTVHMLTKPQFFYDHSTRQALGFQNPCYLKRAQQLKPKMYDGSVIQKTDAIVIHDSEETLMLEDESLSKMLQKQNDPIMSEKKVITKPVDYAAFYQLLKDFETRFVPQTELSAEQAFWSQYSVQSKEPNLSSSTTLVEVPKEFSKVSMVNSSLKKLKFHLASFDMVVKERTTATAIMKGTWRFKQTKACFRDEIIPFVKALKELFNSFDQFLIDELTEVQNVFNQIEQVVEQHCVKKNKFQDKMKNVLKGNERLLEQAISVDIVNIVVHDHVNSAYKTMNVCERCVTIETKLQKDFIKKECYDMLFKKYNTLEKYCISLEVDNQLKNEIYQRNICFRNKVLQLLINCLK